jgi:tRNA dimethylallyltransferase
MQAYRGMDIGTAKPPAELTRRLPHHLIDILDPDEQYTAGDFVREADKACERIRSAGRLPVVSGGTGFYIRNFLCGPASAPRSDPAVRELVTKELETKGAAALRAELLSADPDLCARISEKDVYRLTRAIEILRTSGNPPSTYAPSTVPRDRFRFLVLGIDVPRETLWARIDERVEEMFSAGLPSEVEALKASGYGAGDPGFAAIGYREFLAQEGADLEAIKQEVKLNTRHYAKRQMTFLKALPGIRWIEPDASLLASLLAEFLSEA